MYISNILMVMGGLATLGSAFQNPIRRPGADPSMVVVDNVYYMTTTGGDHISITRSATIWGLLNGQTKTIWTDTNNTRNQQMWAPEMHRIDNTWYMFYSSGGVNTSNRCRVLRGCNGPNPYDCTYTYLAELTPPPGKQGGRMKDDPNAIDGTYLEVNGGRYSVVSANDEGGVQSIQITELDTNTWTVKGWNIISEPDQPWEKNATGADLDPNSPMAVNEGPHPLYHNGQTWLSYSASFCGTPNYALGLLHYVGGDPLKRTSWQKRGPVLSQANGNFGTGHNCFFQSPDETETWNAFHATANPKGNCGQERYVLAQKVSFDAQTGPSLGLPQPLSAMITPPSGEK